ncbi:probable trehalase [Diospyros lotus]|uniref:probable trehalase n=1 Tax=Diospyros lotus TaxID=55363 RepID=UPI0022589BDE|nr:probable trehalase [Diospyros lotus]
MGTPTRINRNWTSLFFSLVFLLFAAMAESSRPCTAGDSGPVVPTTPLVAFLERVQEAALKAFGGDDFDPKLYVDLSLKRNLSVTQKAFDKLPNTSDGAVPASDLNAFIGEYLKKPEVNLVVAEPTDFVRVPEGFLPAVVNRKVRDWALEVHSFWNNLSRKVAAEVFDLPEFHTLLPLPMPVIIPGSRFREVYYWDSYWVIRGLLASKMHETAKGVASNLISLIDEHGYVLNGARAYYNNRSQTPLLSSMIHDIYQRTDDLDFVKKCLPALRKEYKFWTTGIHAVTVYDAHGFKHTLSRYYASWNRPRPESSTTDKETASKLSDDSDKKLLYRQLASTDESGWDFSTRWMRNTSDLTTLNTISILPVDLNSFILKMELDISFLAKATGDSRTAGQFLQFAQARKHSMNTIFWNAKMGQWLDYWVSNGTTCQGTHPWKPSRQNQNVFASNFIPLWIDLFHSDRALVERAVQSLQSSGLIRAVGIATTLTNSGQQWDFPNGWAPLQHMIVEGLVKSGSKEARALAEDIAVRWIRTNYVAYKKSGAMHEKYDVEKCGEFGGGGEYVPQTGFGWSNGVVLSFLEEFGWAKELKIDDCN